MTGHRRSNTLLTPETMTLFAQALRLGHRKVTFLCDHARVHRQCWYDWHERAATNVKEGLDGTPVYAKDKRTIVEIDGDPFIAFTKVIGWAWSDFIIARHKTIEHASTNEKDWRAAVASLRMADPETFAPRPSVQVTHDVAGDLKGQSTALLQALRDQLMAEDPEES